LENKKAVYLDIKFWIILRDVVRGMGNGATEKELLSLLREAVRRNLIFCPISDSCWHRARPFSAFRSDPK